MIKRIFTVLVSITICITMTSSIIAVGNSQITEGNMQKPILSQMSDEDLLQFLADSNITVTPELAATQERLLELARIFISDIEENPSIEFGYGFTHYNIFGNALKTVVNDHYELSNEEQTLSTYVLQDSTKYAYTADMANYNCYAYALGITQGCNPGSFSGTNIQQYQLNDMTAYDLAILVKNDLKSTVFNKPCVKITTSLPYYSSLNSGQTAICIRKGYINNQNNADYHLMRVFSGNEWRHKPGTSAVLSYNELPSNAVNWTNECCVGDVCFEPTTTYSGTIYYIVFGSVHNYPYTGNNYHSGSTHYYEYLSTCSVCGEQISSSYSQWLSISCSGPPCPSSIYRAEDLDKQ